MSAHLRTSSQRGHRMVLIPRLPSLFALLICVALVQSGVYADEPSPFYSGPRQTVSRSEGRNVQGKTAKRDDRLPGSCDDADLAKESFQSVETWSSFHRANLREAVFRESHLVGDDFRDANLEMARFVNCVLPAARFLGANCRQIVFTDCNDVCAVDFSDGNLDAARFVNCSLPAARFVARNARGSTSRIAATFAAGISATPTSRWRDSSIVIFPPQSSPAPTARG